MKLIQYISTPLFALSLATISSMPHAQTYGSYAESKTQMQKWLPYAEIYSKVFSQYPNQILVSSYVDEAKQKPTVYFELFKDGKILELDVDPTTSDIKILRPKSSDVHPAPKISLNEAISLAETNTNAKAISIELDNEDDNPVYVIMLEGNNKQHFVVMHANTAKILESGEDEFESHSLSSKINLAQAISLAEAETGGKAIQAFFDVSQEDDNTNQVGIEMLINNQRHLVTVDTQSHKLTHSSFNEDQQVLKKLANTNVNFSPLGRIVSKLEKQHKGKFTSAELLLLKNKFAYGISLVTDDKSMHFSVDPQTGKVLATETLNLSNFEQFEEETAEPVQW